MLLEHLTIQNFKSIKELTLTDFKRINLFIGKPNVGKSNIIEALSLFSIPYLQMGELKNINSLVRAENYTEFFYNGDVKKDINIKANVGTVNFTMNIIENNVLKININGNSEKINWRYLINNNKNVIIPDKKSKLSVFLGKMPIIKKTSF
jgi:AAA15 family ATPase/GTPase